MSIELILIIFIGAAFISHLIGHVIDDYLKRKK